MSRSETVSSPVSLAVPFATNPPLYGSLRHSKGTAEVQIYPVRNTRTFLIDTPGFDDSSRSDTEILQSITSCVADLHEGLSFRDLEVTLSGVIYIHAINEDRMTGTMKKNLEMFQLLIGQVNMQSCVLVTSKWGLSDPSVAQSRESELVQVEGYWGNLLATGANIGRYRDSQHSALEILELSKRSGAFIPQLTQEYAIDGKQLHQTAAGRAIDEDVADACERHEQNILQWQREHTEALEMGHAQAAEELQDLTLEAESKIKALRNESDLLRMNRDLAQDRMDALEALTVHSHSKAGTSVFHGGFDKQHAREKRAIRWFARFTAMGAGVTMTVLTHGVMAPTAISLYAVVETACQNDKDREAGLKG